MAAGRIFIVAEAGVNHNGSTELALRLVDAAKAAGADAVKFQTFRAARLATPSAPKARYQSVGAEAGESQLQMLRKLELGNRAHRLIAARCRAKGIGFLSTPFDPGSLSFLARDLRISRIKISSGDLTNGPLLLSAARTGKPILLSTGMATLGEVEEALGILAFGYTRRAGNPSPRSLSQSFRSPRGRRFLERKVLLLHCTSEYPSPAADANLRAMATLRAAFGLPVGFSDHTEGIAVAVAAAALGAAAIEKHLTLDRTLPGPDHGASVEPEMFSRMVRGIRETEAALGDGRKIPADGEAETAAVARKSLVASRRIRRGEPFSRGNVTVRRPGTGISPMRYWETLGKRAGREYGAGEVIDR